MPQLEALEERRAIALRHERFNAALITSALVNVNRLSDAPPMSPFDFLVGFERDPAELEKDQIRKNIKRSIAETFTNLALGGASAEEIARAKTATIARLTENGIAEPEELIYEVFPDI